MGPQRRGSCGAPARRPSWKPAGSSAAWACPALDAAAADSESAWRKYATLLLRSLGNPPILTMLVLSRRVARANKEAARRPAA